MPVEDLRTLIERIETIARRAHPGMTAISTKDLLRLLEVLKGCLEDQDPDFFSAAADADRWTNAEENRKEKD